MSLSRIIAATTGLLLAAFAGAPLAAQGGTPVRIGVGGFETAGSVGLTPSEYEALGRAMTALLAAELRGRTGAEIREIVVAPGRGGRLDLAGARTAAGSAGASRVIVGSLLDQYGDVHLEVRVIDLANGSVVVVLRAPASFGKREQLAEALADLAGRVGAEPGMGGTRTAAARPAVAVEALLHFGRGLGLEGAGDKAKAAEAYRAAIKAAPGFTEATAALQRVGGT